jgi:hypothetical protein
LRDDQFARAVGGAVNANRGSGQSPVSGTLIVAACWHMASFCAGLENLFMLLMTNAATLVQTGLVRRGIGRLLCF